MAISSAEEFKLVDFFKESLSGIFDTAIDKGVEFGMKLLEKKMKELDFSDEVIRTVSSAISAIAGKALKFAFKKPLLRYVAKGLAKLVIKTLGVKGFAWLITKATGGVGWIERNLEIIKTTLEGYQQHPMNNIETVSASGVIIESTPMQFMSGFMSGFKLEVEDIEYEFDFED